MKKPKLQKKEKSFRPCDLPRKRKKAVLKSLNEIANKKYVWNDEDDELYTLLR
jgi:hypothetical protein